MNKYFSSIFNLAIYFSSGIAAPFFFRNIPDRHRAGLYAGALFVITALRAVRLSLTRPYAMWVRWFFGVAFFIFVGFWIWPIRELHHFMTMLYSVSCGVIIYSEVRWLRKN